MTQEEFEEANGVEPEMGPWIFDSVRNLEEAVEGQSEIMDNVEYRDRMAFVHFLEEFLDVDAETRVTPEEALQHCFVKMAHLEEDMDTSSYADTAFELMTICPLDDSEECPASWRSEDTDADPRTPIGRSTVQIEPFGSGSTEASVNMNSVYEDEDPPQNLMILQAQMMLTYRGSHFGLSILKIQEA